MALMSWPKMVVSDTEGWTEMERRHPSVRSMFFSFVVPMSLIPPVMYAYSQMVYPGVLSLAIQPPLSMMEIATVGILFFLIELATVSITASYIQELGGLADVHPPYAAAYMLAAIAPTPLWLAALALFVPSRIFNLAVIVLAWLCCVALIRHGVRAVFHPVDAVKARRMANIVTAAGVGIWITMLLVLVMMMGIVLGWR